MLAAPDTMVCFGRWQLDLQRRVLLADGLPVTLSGRGFDMLALLVERRGQVVTRNEIVAHVWRDVTVGENNLTVQMSALRQTLKTHGGAGLIVTVPGRGYRFVDAPEAAERVDSNASPAIVVTTPPTRSPHVGPARRQRFAAMGFVLVLLAGVAAGLVLRGTPTPPRLSIAVMPFRNLSAGPAQDHLADAVTDDLTTDLAHLPASTVIARESAEVYRNVAESAQKIGAALHVRYLVQGSVRVETGYYHVTAQIIDTASGAHLWASRFDSTQGSLSQVRDTIVRRLATALGFQLEQIEGARSRSDRPKDPDALDLFLRARALLDLDGTLARLTEAQAMLEDAVAQQPSFGDALAQLGSMLLVKVHDMDDPTADSDLDEARSMIRRALDVAPRNALALASQARVLALEGRWTEASDSAQAALAIEPSSVEAESVLAVCTQAAGRLDEALDHLRAVLRLSPNSPSIKPRLVAIGFIQLVQGSLEPAIESLHQGIAGDGDTDGQQRSMRVETARLLLIAAKQMAGKSAEAKAMYENYSATWPNRTVWRVAGLFNRVYVDMPGFARIMDALERAGMPRYADEHRPSADPTSLCSGTDSAGTDFAEPPSKLDVGQTWDTSIASSHLRLGARLLLLDLGRGVASPTGAVWFDEANSHKTATRFALDEAKSRFPSDPDAPIAVMGDGTSGCTAYKAAHSLVTAGFRNVAWYRGGEEAWAKARLPSIDRRPQ